MPRPSIQFLSELPAFKLSNQRKIAHWLKTVCESENRPLDTLTYVFCSDDFLLSLNTQYLNHTAYTDILTFDYSEKGEISGEIYVSVPRVVENAKKYHQPFEIELRRVIVHGLLHLLGYGDKGLREKGQMRRKEEACLSLWQ